MHHPFYPRRTRIVARVLEVVLSLGTIFFLIIVPTDGPLGFKIWDRIFTVITIAAIVVFMEVHARVEARPSEEGLWVRNLVRRRFFTWPEILGVDLGHRPWASIDLSNGTEFPVMAIQRSDGARAQSEATRLASLIASASS